MTKALVILVLALAIAVSGTWFVHTIRQGVIEETLVMVDQHPVGTAAHTHDSPATPAETPSSQTSHSTQTSTASKGLSQSQLLALADNTYADGWVPLGDYHYVTTGAKKGYVYLCNARKDNPGSMVNGPWISGSSWNFLQKVTIDGSVSWPTASFSNVVAGAYRTLTGNDLPVSHTTGVFPVAQNDDAHQYDANPNTISAQSFTKKLPTDPVYSETPYCMGGEAGVMLSGVALFNAFDAGLRDAPAHELQDSCDGHPQGSGQYHYHSMSGCVKDIGVSVVLGYALDGFPITGPKVSEGKYLTTADLDECHGLTSDVLVDGKTTTTYHYVMTQDFPYSVSCFHAKPVSMMVVEGGGGPTQQQGGAPQQGGGTNGSAPTPPQEAITACSGKSSGASCSFSMPQGTISGVCRTPPNSSLACVPQ